MRVGIDVSRVLLQQNYGVPLYVEALIETLLECPTSDTVLLTSDHSQEILVAALRRRGIDRALANCLVTSHHRRHDFLAHRVTKVGSRFLSDYAGKIDAGLLKPFYERVTPLHKGLVSLDVFHHTDYIAHHVTRLKCRHVMNLHDMVPTIYPQFCSRGWIDFAAAAYRFAQEKASAIITYSEASRRDIIHYLGIAEQKIHVIPLAVRTSLPKISSDDFVQHVQQRYHILPKAFVLGIGRLDSLKNLRRLVEGFAQVCDSPGMRDLKLVLAGPEVTSEVTNDQSGQAETIKDLIRFYRLEQRCVLTGYVDDETLSVLFRTCACFVYPTLYEGFGLPVLEAMALGAPVVASNTSSIPEVASDAALLVNPLSADEIGNAIRTVIVDETLAAKLITRGHERVALFSWKKVAEQHWDVYRAVA